MSNNPQLYSSLSEEVLPKTSPSRLMIIIGMVILLFAGFNAVYYFYIAEHDDIYGDTVNWADVNAMEAPVDVLIFGDSVAESGINPAVIEAETGLTAHNLALTAWWVYYNDVWILERYIERFGPPKAIIWAHVFEVSNRSFNPVQRLGSTSYPYGFTWSSDYLNLNLSNQEKLDIIAQRLFPLYFRSQTTQMIAQDLLTGHDPLATVDDVMNGFSIKPPVDDNTVVQLATDRAWSLHGPYIVSEENQRVSDILFQMSETYDILLYVVITPVHNKVHKNDKYLPGVIPQLEYWQEQSQKYETVEFNPELLSYGTEYMRDGTHLNSDGADLYTQYLVDWIWGNYTPMSLADIIED